MVLSFLPSKYSERENLYFLEMERSSGISRTCILLYFIIAMYETKIFMKYPEQSQHTQYLLICLLYLTSFHEVHAFVSTFLPFDSNILELIAPTINNYIMQSYYLRPNCRQSNAISHLKKLTFISIRSNLSVVLI